MLAKKDSLHNDNVNIDSYLDDCNSPIYQEFDINLRFDLLTSIQLLYYGSTFPGCEPLGQSSYPTVPNFANT